MPARRAPLAASPRIASDVSLDEQGLIVSAVAGSPSHRHSQRRERTSGRMVLSRSGSSCLAAMSPDGSQIAVATAHRKRRGIEAGWIFPIAAGAPRARFQARPWAGINGASSWSPDGAYLSGSSFVWDTATGDWLHSAEHGVVVESSSWSRRDQAGYWGRRLGEGLGRGFQRIPIDRLAVGRWRGPGDGCRVRRQWCAGRDGGRGCGPDLGCASMGNEEREGLSLPSIYTGSLMFDPGACSWSRPT